MAEKEKTTFIEKLREKQENQRALVTAIDELHLEQKRIMVVRIKYFFGFIAFIIVCWYSFDAVSPVVGPFFETFRLGKDKEVPATAENKPAAVPKPVAGVDFSHPDLRQQAAASEGWVTPLPVSEAEDPGYYEKFRPPPPETAGQYVTAFTPTAADIPPKDSYNSLNQLPVVVVELDKDKNLDK